MANIQPTNTFTYPLNWNANKIEIIVNSFPLFPNTVEVFWTLSNEEKSFGGSMIIPNEVVSQWGTDDLILENYVISQLNLVKTIIEETPPTETPINETPIDPII